MEKDKLGPGGLFERLKRILQSIEGKLAAAEREKEIIRLLQSIDDSLARLGGSCAGAGEAEIVKLLNETFGPRIERLKGLATERPDPITG